VKRGCDDSTTIDVDNIAPHDYVMVNKTQQYNNQPIEIVQRSWGEFR
jgi:hypothetical protein